MIPIIIKLLKATVISARNSPFLNSIWKTVGVTLFSALIAANVGSIVNLFQLIFRMSEVEIKIGFYFKIMLFFITLFVSYVLSWSYCQRLRWFVDGDYYENIDKEKRIGALFLFLTLGLNYLTVIAFGLLSRWMS